MRGKGLGTELQQERKKEAAQGRGFHTPFHSSTPFAPFCIFGLLLGPKFSAFWLRSSVLCSVGGFPVGVSVACMHALAVLWCNRDRFSEARPLSHEALQDCIAKMEQRCYFLAF